LDTHAELVENIITLSHELKKVDIHFFVSEKIANLLSLNVNDKISIANNKNILTLLQKHHFDAVIIGTAHRYFNVFLEISNCFPTSILVHNANFVQMSKRQLFSKIWENDIFFRLKLLLKEGLLIMPLLYRNASSLLVLDENISTSMGKFQNKTKTISVFFNRFCNDKPNKMQVVIPGAVSQYRRDYHHIFAKLKTMQSSMNFVFLGKASGSELKLLNELQNTLSPTVAIKYFDHKVSKEKFQTEMKEASVLWCPLQKEIKFFGQTEIYGLTKISGNIGDAINYGKIAILPTTYPCDYPFVLNENLDIEQQLTSYHNTTFDFENNYSIEKIAQQLEELLCEI
jgi:hypothetical protein